MSSCCCVRCFIPLIGFFLIFVLRPAFAKIEPACRIPEVTIYPSALEDRVLLGKYLDLNSIKFFQESSVSDALKQIPGVNTSSFGAFAPQSYIALRGANTEHTLVRLMGVEVNDPSAGGRFDFSTIFPEDTEALTVSNSSALSAIGGAVDIEPRKGCGKLDATLTAEGGSYRTTRTRAELAGSTNRQHYFISGNLLKSGTGHLKNPLHGNTASDRHLSENINTRFGHQVNTIWDVDIYLSQSKSKYGINRPLNGLPYKSTDHGVHQQEMIVVKNHVQTLQDRWNHDIILSNIFHRRDSSIYSQGYADKSRTLGITYNTHFKVQDHHQLLTSLSLTQDRVKLSTSTAQQLESRSGEVTYRTDAFSKLTVELKGRLDHHEFFKTHPTYLGHTKYQMHPLFSVFSSYGTSFRAPTAFDFYASGPYSVGNPNLKPMTSKNFELGSETTPFKGISLALTYFRLNIKNLLVTIRTPEGKYQRVNQVGRLAEGLEASARFQSNPVFQWRLGYTLTEATDKQTKSSAIRVPRHQFNLGIQATYFKNMTLFAEGFYRSSSPDTAFLDSGQQRVALPASFSVRLGGAYQLNDHAEIKGRIENLLNDHSEDIYGYPNRGLSFLISVTLKT